MKIRFVGLILSVVLLLGMVACAENSPESTPTATSQPTSTIAPSQTVTLTIEPSATIVPTATSFPSTFPLGEAAYLIPPTIRYVNENTITIFFELDQPVSGSVFLVNAETGLIGQQQEFGVDETHHMITFEELETGATYRIAPLVEASDGWQSPQYQGEDWGSIQATTPSYEYPIRVGIISDASFGDEVSAQLIANMAESDLDFVLHLGDVVDELEWGADPFASFARIYFQQFEPLLKQMPVYTVPGNHDYDMDIRYQDEPFYYYAFPAAPQVESRQYRSLVVNDIQFLLFDAMTMWGMPGRAEQDAWLEERLQDDQYRINIPIFHIAPFNSSVVHPEDSAPIRNFWVPLFENANVPLSFSGHYQHYERLTNNGITYIIAGGGSSYLYAIGEYQPGTVIATRTAHFVLLEIFTNTLEVTAYGVDGEVIDSVSIEY